MKVSNRWLLYCHQLLAILVGGRVCATLGLSTYTKALLGIPCKFHTTGELVYLSVDVEVSSFEFTDGRCIEVVEEESTADLGHVHVIEHGGQCKRFRTTSSIQVA